MFYLQAANRGLTVCVCVWGGTLRQSSLFLFQDFVAGRTLSNYEVGSEIRLLPDERVTQAGFGFGFGFGFGYGPSGAAALAPLQTRWGDTDDH